MLDIGAGTGRVALDLARAGHRVTALERSPALLEALARRAGGLPVQTVVGDARDFRLGEGDFDLCLVPMQTLQLLRSEDERRALFLRAAAHLRPGALLACAIVTAADEFDAMAASSALPGSPGRGRARVRLAAARVRVLDGSIRIERERVALPGNEDGEQRWREAGERDVVELACVTEEQLWQEAAGAGLHPEPTLLIAETDEHTGSEVVMLRA